MRIEKTVFISYRRTNMPWALAIYQYLTAQGYDVFFDYLSIPSGDFEKVIIENIRGRAHFLVVLTPSALERCSEPGDWLRREIEVALDNQRNVVPLLVESFDFGTATIRKRLTGKLEKLSKYNGLRIPFDYFFEAMQRLCDQFLTTALDAVIHPISSEAKLVAEEHKIAASETEKVEVEDLNAQDWYEKGVLFWHDNPAEALRCFNEAIALKPKWPEAYRDRGGILHDYFDLDRGIADYDEAIRLNPNLRRVFGFRGEARHLKRDLKKAQADLEFAVQNDPSDDYAYNRLGILLEEIGDLDGALIAFDRAYKLDPHPAYLNNIANVHMQKKDFDVAKKFFSKRIDLEPDTALSAEVSLGIIHLIQNQPDSALHFQKALDVWENAHRERLQTKARLLENKALALLCLGEKEDGLVALAQSLASGEIITYLRFEMLLTASNPPEGIQEAISLIGRKKGFVSVKPPYSE